MNNIETLAKQAATVLDMGAWVSPFNESGFEVLPGFFSVHNDWAGQSKAVLHHLESNLIFKTDWDSLPQNSSKTYIGEVTFTQGPRDKETREGTYRVRLPEFWTVETDEMTVSVMEYVDGETCCDLYGGWCSHAYAMVEATNCRDAHNGNYLIKDGEVVLFDYEGIRL